MRQLNYTGSIIEESLQDPKVLTRVKILKTEIEPVNDSHKTPWLKQWTMHTIDVSENDANIFAQKLSRTLDKDHPTWYVDYKNEYKHYIIFRDKVFIVKRKNKEEYSAVKAYGIKVGIPEQQLDFA